MFFPTVVTQLTETIDSVRTTVAHALEGDSTLGGKDLTQQFEELLLKPVSAVVEQQ